MKYIFEKQWTESLMLILIIAWAVWQIGFKGAEITGVIGIAIGVLTTLGISYGIPGTPAVGTYSKEEYDAK